MAGKILERTKVWFGRQKLEREKRFGLAGRSLERGKVWFGRQRVRTIGWNRQAEVWKQKRFGLA